LKGNGVAEHKAKKARIKNAVTEAAVQQARAADRFAHKIVGILTVFAALAAADGQAVGWQPSTPMLYPKLQIRMI